MKFQINTKRIYISIVIIFCVIICGILLKNFSANAMAHFLNVNKPIENAEVLLVEGWINYDILNYVKEEFIRGSYKYILVSGMEESQPDSIRNKHNEDEINAWTVAQALIDTGINPTKIKVSACHLTSMHKTFSMALAAKNWLSVNDPSIRRINICTARSHGRKTWCAYKKVFGNNIKAGIFSFPKIRKPISQWFLSRGGFIYQLYSLVGYIYVSLWPVGLAGFNLILRNLAMQ